MSAISRSTLAGDQTTSPSTAAPDSNTIDVARGPVDTSVTVDSLQSISISSADAHTVIVDSGLGHDSIHVTGAGGPFLTVVGGQTPAADSLSIDNSAFASPDVFNPGATPDSGQVTSVAGTVHFSGISSLSLSGADHFLADRQRHERQRRVHAKRQQRDRKRGAPISLSGYNQLNFQGNGGADQFQVVPGSTTRTISVFGSLAAGSTLQATANAGGGDALTVRPTSAGVGLLDDINISTSLPLAPSLNYFGIANIVLVGQAADGDTAAVTGTTATTR